MDLYAENIHKSFGEKQVLRGISLRAQGGRALGLLGRNGAGKTTLIRIIMSVFPPDSGRVLLGGKTLSQADASIGYLPEERGLYQKKPILEQMVYFAALQGMPRRQARANALALLGRVGLGEYANRKLEVLSKGNQQKVQLAAALTRDPDILILDEPFSGLDPVNAMLLKDIVRERIAKGRIVFFSSHQMSYVEEFCEHIAILSGGQIVLEGTIRDIKRNYDRSRLLVDGADAAALSSFVRENPRLVSALLPGNILQMPGVQLKNELIAALLAQGVDFDGVRVYEPSLNDIFVERTEAGI